VFVQVARGLVRQQQFGRAGEGAGDAARTEDPPPDFVLI